METEPYRFYFHSSVVFKVKLKLSAIQRLLQRTRESTSSEGKQLFSEHFTGAVLEPGIAAAMVLWERSGSDAENAARPLKSRPSCASPRGRRSCAGERRARSETADLKRAPFTA